MLIQVMIDMQNQNALIALAIVSGNTNNPYAVFEEYIKYCMSTGTSATMQLSEIRKVVSEEFGLNIPYNVMMRCLLQLEKVGFLVQEDHQFRRIGSYDSERFDLKRTEYRNIEDSLIQSLIQYVKQYQKDWTRDYARECLTKVLDRSGLAYDIFIRSKSGGECDSRSSLDTKNMDEIVPDDEGVQQEDAIDQPMYSDDFFVGKFVQDTLGSDSSQRDYLLHICEGLMLCVGAYQIPSPDVEIAAPQIQATEFFFDTRLLLRYVGCAGEAAIEATHELVKMIQSSGGTIRYYPQTLVEMSHAFDEAISALENRMPPSDNEMRLYASANGNNPAILRAKNASLKEELSKAGILLRPNENFTDHEMLRFGFDQSDLRIFMEDNLSWKKPAIENDAMSIWETHMRRNGNYTDYYGTKDRLPVFVSHNPRLAAVSLDFRNARPNLRAISQWKSNRLPVITDIRLTCRLWDPSTQSERLSLLYLTANAVAAQKPTKTYINTVRKLAIQLSEQVPEYSAIPLPSYFDDYVTNAILETTKGDETRLDIGNFASTIAELTEMKVRDQERNTARISDERDSIQQNFENQRRDIIDDAVNRNKGCLGLGWIVALRAALWWPLVMTVVFAGLSAVLSDMLETNKAFWIAAIPAAVKTIEVILSSKVIEKKLVSILLPKAKRSMENRIELSMGKAERPYKAEIITSTIEKNKLLIKCDKLLSGKN